jgi:hypothetical protein
MADINALVAIQGGALPSVFSQDRDANKNELAAGIGSSFATISYKGKTWAVKYQGDLRMLMRPDNPREPRFSIDVVLLKSAANISKIFYEKGYQDGDSAPPDCWSSNGVNPDAASPKKQSPTCAGCKWNAFGSAALLRNNTDGTGKGKACADSKRVAIVPLEDIDNEAFNGPMMIRVPAASLRELSTYADQLNAAGIPYYAVGTNISFDPAVAHPQLKMAAIRMLTEQEAMKVLNYRGDPKRNIPTDDRVERILSAPVEQATHEPEAPAMQPSATSALFANGQAPEVPAALNPETPAPVVQQPVAPVVEQPVVQAQVQPQTPPPPPVSNLPPPPVERPILIGENQGHKFRYYGDTGEFIEYLPQTPPPPPPAAPKATKPKAAKPEVVVDNTAAQAAGPVIEADAVDTGGSIAEFDNMLDALLPKK